MLTSFIALFAFALSFAIATPEPAKAEDIAQLLQVASVAGITLPSDPAVILALGDVADNLAEALPTAPVLSVLLTAAPPSFISNIVHDQSFANSFESAFAAGSSPSWFNALPTSVKSYLHTYSGFGGLAQAAAAVQTGALSVTPTSRATTKSTASTTSPSPTSTQSASENAITGSTATSSAPVSTTSPNSARRLGGALSASLVGVLGMLTLVMTL